MFVSKLISFRFLVFGFWCLILCSSAGTLHAQADVWQVARDSNFSFEYPSGWKLQRNANGRLTEIQATSPDSIYTLAVSFESGLTNQAGILNQCATVDEYLQFYYDERYSKPFDTGTGQYPYTTVTNDGFQPGFLGGKSTYVTINHVEKWQQPVSWVYYMTAIPRSGGFYLATYGHPSEPMQVSQYYQQRFLRSIKFTAPNLDVNAKCNYLGGR